MYTVLIGENPDAELRELNDHVVVSKGHAALALYAVLYHKNLIPFFLDQYQKDGGRFCEEITIDSELGFRCSTGSLGLGLPFIAGKALKSKRNKDESRYFVIMGDGECDEGSVWESVMFAAHYGLDNICLIIDRNRLQADGETEKIITKSNLSGCLTAFGWEVLSVDGHSYEQILKAISTSANGKPVAILANTIKGKGISFMENEYLWHDRVLGRDLLEKAKMEVGID